VRKRPLLYCVLSRRRTDTLQRFRPRAWPYGKSVRYWFVRSLGRSGEWTVRTNHRSACERGGRAGGGRRGRTPTGDLWRWKRDCLHRGSLCCRFTVTLTGDGLDGRAR